MWDESLGTTCGRSLRRGNPRGAEKSWGSQLLPVTAVAIVVQGLIAGHPLHTHIYHERTSS